MPVSTRRDRADKDKHAEENIRSMLKPSPNGLTSPRTFWTCVQLAFHVAAHLPRLASTCDDLRGLALTLAELKFGRK